MTKLWNTKNITLSSFCAWCIPLPYLWFSYLGNIQVTAQVENSSYQAGKPDPVCERHCPVRKRNLVFDYLKCRQLRLTGVAEGCWQIRGGPFSSGLPQGALFTQIICNSLFRLCALSGILHTSPELWKRRVHESVLVAILLGRSWLSDDIISVP